MRRIRTFLATYWRSIFLIVILVIGGYQVFTQYIADDSGYATNIYTELLGIAITYLVIDSVVRNQERLEERRENELALLDQLKTSIVSDMAAEFHNDEMLKARSEAYRVFIENKTSNSRTDDFTKLFNDRQQYTNRNSEMDSFYLSRLLRFYERLGQLYKLERVDEKLAYEFFAYYFADLYNQQDFKRFLKNQNNDIWRWYKPMEYLVGILTPSKFPEEPIHVSVSHDDSQSNNIINRFLNNKH